MARLNYKIIKQDNGKVTTIDKYYTIADAREALIGIMADCAHGDVRFIMDDAQKQSEIDGVIQLGKDEEVDFTKDIEKMKSWTPPCLVIDSDEICHIDNDCFTDDNLTSYQIRKL